LTYTQAAANVLTNHQVDPVGKIPGFAACTVTKAGEGERVAAE
jgi:hypothetical protein